MPQNIVIIGAVALGPKAACRFKRLEPESKVTMIDQDNLISYGGCGIPYFISGDVSDPGLLQATSFNMLRDEKFFREAKDIQVIPNTRAVTIDRASKTVHTKNVVTGEDKGFPYDKLVLATGSISRRLQVPGFDLDRVFTVSNMNDAIAIKEMIAGGKVGKALIIGAGAIGLEMAEALADLWGIETAVVEIADQILPGIVSPNLARMAQRHMEENGISFYLSENIRRIEGDKAVDRVITDKNTIPTDLVISAVGVEPNSYLARKAGLDISDSGAIIVNNRLQTSDPDIFAGGDCIEITNLITGESGYFPLGSMANRQGRVIGSNLAGGEAVFEGAVGRFVIKLFDISVASAGLNINIARKKGFDAISAFIVQFDRAHFYPEKDLMSLELAYSPPFSAAMDILNALGNTAENILEGKNRIMDVDEFAELWRNRENDETLFLDCRGHGNAEPFLKKYPQYWKNIPQDELMARIDQVPKDKKILLICNTGVRSYEAQVTLDHMGIRESFNLQGGMAALKTWGLDI